MRYKTNIQATLYDHYSMMMMMMIVHLTPNLHHFFFLVLCSPVQLNWVKNFALLPYGKVTWGNTLHHMTHFSAVPTPAYSYLLCRYVEICE